MFDPPSPVRELTNYVEVRTPLESAGALLTKQSFRSKHDYELANSTRNRPTKGKPHNRYKSFVQFRLRKKELHEAITGGHYVSVRLLSEDGVHIEAENSDEQTPLQVAAENGDDAMVELLLKNGANVNAKNPHGLTALHKAAASGHHAAVKLLLEKGADIEAKSADGQTALGRAAANKHESAVKNLLDKGADVNTTDSLGHTALSRAVLSVSYNIVKLLLENGADTNTEDVDELATVVHGAGSECYRILKLLRHKRSTAEAEIDRVSPEMTDKIWAGVKDQTQTTLITHDQSSTSSETTAATDTSTENDISGTASETETDWGVENTRDILYREIYDSNKGKHFTNSEVTHFTRMLFLIEPKKQSLINTLMYQFYLIFRGAFQIYAAGHESSPSGAIQDTAATSNELSTDIAGARRRLNDDEDNLGNKDNDDDGHHPKHPKRSSGVSQDEIAEQKFACPYHQHNPLKYGILVDSSEAEYRSCAGPGWKSVARIKEHLYRRHRNPIKCSRYSSTFKSQENLNTHLRSLVLCEIQPEEPQEGITAEMEKKLKSRKKPWPNQTEEDRWRTVYQILFPNEGLPSPYYYYKINMAKFEDYSRRETPRVFIGMLQNRARTNHLTEEIQNELVEIVQECWIFVYRRYLREAMQNAPTDSNPTEPASAEPPVNSPNENESTNSSLDFPLPPEVDDYDPDIFEAIFRDNNLATMDPKFLDIYYEIRSEYQCFCMTTCSCLPSSIFD